MPYTVEISVSDTTLLAGETSVVTIVFSEAVSSFSNANLTIEHGTLSAVSTSDGGLTWTAVLTPQTSVIDATNVITLDMDGIDAAVSGAQTGTAQSNNYEINTVRPFGVVTLDDSALRIGETAQVTITFSEAVTGFSNQDLIVSNGTLSSVVTSDNINFTATFTPTAGIESTSNVITLVNSGYSNQAGNAGEGTTSSSPFGIDTLRPTASIAVADDDLGRGETTLVTFTFSEAVTGFSADDLTVQNGNVAGLSSIDGGFTWTGTLTPTANITDATNLITLNLTGVADAAGNTGAGTQNSNNYAVNTDQLTATIVVADDVLLAGESSLVTFTFSEAVIGFTDADVTAVGGTLTNVISSDGGVTFTATFTPTPNLVDPTNVITVNLAGIATADQIGGAGTATSNNYEINTVRPTATFVFDNPRMGIGETSLVTFTFSEAVTGFGPEDLVIDGGVLSALSTSDNIVWTATFTPDTDAVVYVSGALLYNTGFTNAAGNAGVGTTRSNSYIVDDYRPTAEIVVSDTALTRGETSLVTITFSEAVSDFTNADLTVANGTLSAVSSNDGGRTWTATLTPTNLVNSASNVITLNNTGVVDIVGNAGEGVTVSNTYSVNTPAPPRPPAPAGPTEQGDILTLSNRGGEVRGLGGDDDIRGGNGDDFIQGNAGEDTLAGGGGDDTLRGGQGDDTVQGNEGDDLVFGDLGDDTVHGGRGDDLVQGNGGNDLVFGDLGDDTVRGGQGDDQVFGGEGDDFIAGDLGNDTLSGGAGADIFFFAPGGGRDVVTDFSGLDGDVIHLNGIDTYTIAQVGADTVLTLDGGGQVVLLGVSLGTFDEDWIVGV